MKTNIENFHDYGGLRIQSCLPLLAHPAKLGKADVNIRWGQVPRALDDADGEGPFWQKSPRRFLFCKDKVARYLVQNGCEIIIEAFVEVSQPVSQMAIRNYLMSSAMGALFHQRGLLALHASAVAVDDGCVVFVGPSGAGKSTLAAFLSRQRGCTLLAEDLCVVDCGAAHEGLPPQVQPGASSLRLWKDSLQALGASDHECEPTLVKNKWYLSDAKERVEKVAERPLPLKQIYLLKEARDPRGEPRIEPVDVPTALRGLLRYTFRKRFLCGPLQLQGNFLACNALAEQIPVYTLYRGTQLDNIEATLSLLASHGCKAPVTASVIG